MGFCFCMVLLVLFWMGLVFFFIVFDSFEMLRFVLVIFEINFVFSFSFRVVYVVFFLFLNIFLIFSQLQIFFMYFRSMVFWRSFFRNLLVRGNRFRIEWAFLVFRNIEERVVLRFGMGRGLGVFLDQIQFRYRSIMMEGSKIQLVGKILFQIWLVFCKRDRRVDFL